MSSIIELKSGFKVNLPNGSIEAKNIIINSGDFVLLTGLNGSGKTTLMKVLLGYDSNNANGEALFCGQNILELSDEQKGELRKSIAYLEQDDMFFSRASIIDALMSPALQAVGKELKLKAKELAKQYYDKYLCDWISNSTKKVNPYKRNANNLSGGQKKFLHLLSILIKIELCGVKLVFFDEPLNSLDLERKKQLGQIIKDLPQKNKEKDFAVIMISHCPIFPEVDHVMQIDDGILTIRSTQDGDYCNCVVAQKCNERGDY